MKEITAYKTEDGEVFENQAGAIKHEQVKSFADFLEHHGDMYFHPNGSSIDDVASYILVAYTLTSK